MYRSEKQGEKSDALTRRAQDLSKKLEDFREQHRFQILLKSENLDENIKKSLSILFCENEIKNDVDLKTKTKKNTNETEGQFEEAGKNEEELTPINTNDLQNESIKNTIFIKEFFEQAYEGDEIIQDIMKAKRKELRKLNYSIISYEKDSNDQGKIYEFWSIVFM